MNFQSLFKEYTPVEYGDFFAFIESTIGVISFIVMKIT